MLFRFQHKEIYSVHCTIGGTGRYIYATIVMVPFVAISEQALNKDMVPDFSISSSALFSLWHNGNIQVAPYSAKD
jgi:hypothetical protein